MERIARLGKEVSKKRWTWNNGCELMIMSAEGDAMRLMGHGGDVIIEDEECLIDAEVHRQKITRMLGDNPNSMYIGIGNPWHRNNQMWKHWINPKFKKIHIDWRIGLKEGRITQEHIDEQHDELSELEFKVLYDADFPEDAEDTLIRWKWIQDAINKKFKGAIFDKTVFSQDVAEMGRDLTVTMRGKTCKEDLWDIKKIWSWGKCDTGVTVDKTIPILEKDCKINVDGIGVGAGVWPQYKKKGFNAIGIKVSESPDVGTDNKGRFKNKKSQFYWRLRELFEQGKISIPKHPILINQLSKISYNASSGKIKIIDPNDGKSPDFADALMLLCSKNKNFTFAFI